MSVSITHQELKETGSVTGIPVRNIWLLMLYASELFRHAGCGKTAVEDNPDDIPDLVAEMLVYLVARRLKRNLSFGYRQETAVLNRVRGRIDLLNTERHQLQTRGRVACRFDAITVNTPRNRFVRAALDRIAGMVNRPELAGRCRSLARSLKQAGVTGEKPNRSEMSVDRLGRHDAEDRMMLAAARLAFDLALPTEMSGAAWLLSPDRDIQWLRRLYEKAVAGFYEVVLSGEGWKVDPGQVIKWPITAMTPGISDILPTMRTDIILEHKKEQKRILIDTKFNAILTRGYFREQTLRSGYLYQIYAYLRSQERDDDPQSRTASGLLLHPAVGEQVDESVMIQGHEIRFATVDLAASARVIRTGLLNVVK
ncbi:MAG: 5-methylcytosine-specific restriction enzyme subunit McrC [Candidatus Hydrogenedentes bacterium ADurb.Bin179]|nr:MAG: 5-methylcytosine-specific restriction enzyme subunit McrC [Candidatus Hydrogenedentes bacterium ADurb.Bin179]